jgi:hypothetical protein
MTNRIGHRGTEKKQMLNGERGSGELKIEKICLSFITAAFRIYYFSLSAVAIFIREEKSLICRDRV